MSAVRTSGTSTAASSREALPEARPASEPEPATPPLEATDAWLAEPEPTSAPAPAEPELPPEPTPAPSPREPEPDPFRVEDDVFAAEEKR